MTGPVRSWGPDVLAMVLLPRIWAIALASGLWWPETGEPNPKEPDNN